MAWVVRPAETMTSTVTGMMAMRMGNMLLPIIIAIVPVTVLVLASAGRTTQALTSRRKNKEAAHD